VDSQPAELTAPPGQQHGLKQLGLVRTFGLGLLIIALWTATRPYQGIFHDSRFYTVEALNTLLPGRFSHDLYFQYGSQGQFTIFSLIYSPLISALGLSGANIALTIAAQCLWLSGLSYLSLVLFRGWKPASMAVVAAILLPSGSLLHYGEPFVTPRSFAEALTLWALGSQLKERPIRALGLLGISMLIHPLMTLPGLAVWFLYQAARRPVLWFLAAIAIATVCGLALADIQPFARLLIRFDPAWFEIIRVRENFCFVGLWEFGRWIPIWGAFALGLFELVLATPKERRVLMPVFAVGAGGILASFIGGDLLRNVLLFDIQTWRSVWIFMLFANLFAVKIFLRFADARPAVSPMALWLFGLALGLMVISQFFVVAMMGAAAVLILAVTVGCWEWITKRPVPRAVQLVVALLVGCSLGTAAIGANVAIDGVNVDPAEFWRSVRVFVLSSCVLTALWFFLFRSRILSRKKLYLTMLVGTALGLVGIVSWQWDQRTPWTKFIDTADPPADLTDLLPGGAPIYWENDVTVPWFLLRRPSYFSCDQGTGALFSRGTAIAYDARFRNFQKLQTLDFRQYSFCPLTDARRTAPLRRADLSMLCAKEAGLGALVLTERAGDAPYRTWISPVPFKSKELSAGGGMKAFSADRFYIYKCADLR